MQNAHSSTWHKYSVNIIYYCICWVCFLIITRFHYFSTCGEQVSILVKANSMTLTTLLWVAGPQEEIIKDLNGNQAGRAPCQRAVTPLFQGRVTPIRPMWYFPVMEMTLQWMAGKKNTKWHTGVDKDNNRDN